MSSDIVFTAVQNFLYANFTTAPLSFENETPSLPEPPSLWVWVEIYDIMYEQVSMGSGHPTSDLWREEGAVIAHVMVPVNTGSLLARQVATQIARLFVGLQLQPGIRFERCTIGGSPEIGDGNFWPFDVRVEWCREDSPP